MKRLVGEHFKLHGQPKRPFPSREAAVKHAGKAAQHPYRCSFCGAWHLAKDRG